MSTGNPITIVSHKVGLNGVTTVTRTQKSNSTRAGSRGLSVPRDKPGVRDVPEVYRGEESWAMAHGALVPDELIDVTTSHKTITLTKLTEVTQANEAGKISGGALLKFCEETGTVLCTRYCNYTSAEHSLRTGATFDQVYCGMMYVDYLELLLPAYAGQLLTCVADIYFTASHAMEVKSVVWAEDLVTCSRRLICKTSAWYGAFNVENEWRLMKIPKLVVEGKMEREGVSRYEIFKEQRRSYNSAKIEYSGHSASNGQDKQTAATNTVKYSEMLLTHLANIHDCGAHVYVQCGSLLTKMEECASLVARRHSKASQVSTACGYHFNFIEFIHRGSLVILYGRLTFTSKRLMEVEVLVDVEVTHDLQIDTKRVAAGYFCLLALDADNKTIPFPNLKVRGAEEEGRYAEGQARFDNIRKYLVHPDGQLMDLDTHLDTKKVTMSSNVHTA